MIKRVIIQVILKQFIFHYYFVMKIDWTQKQKKAQTEDKLWGSIVQQKQNESKGALIIYNERQANKGNSHMDNGLQKLLESKGYKVARHIRNIENNEIESQSKDHLLKQIIDFYRQNFYISLVHIYSHRTPSQFILKNKKHIEIFVQKDKKKDKSYKIDLPLEAIFDTWRPTVLKHIIFSFEICQMAGVREIIKQKYARYRTINVLSASDKYQYIIHTYPSNKEVFSSFRELIKCSQNGIWTQAKIQMFHEDVKKGNLSINGISNNQFILLDFIEKDVINKLKRVGINQQVINTISTSLDVQIKKQPNRPLRYYKQDTQKKLKSYYYGQGENLERNHLGSFWNRTAQRQLFYSGTSINGLFVGDGFIKNKLLDCNYQIKGWGNFRQGHLQGECYIQQKKQNPRKNISTKNQRLTTMYKHYISPQNKDQNYEILFQNNYFNQTKQSKSSFSFRMWAGILIKQVNQQQQQHTYLNEKSFKIIFYKAKNVPLVLRILDKSTKYDDKIQYLSQLQFNRRKDKLNLLNHQQLIYTIQKTRQKQIKIGFQRGKDLKKNTIFECLRKNRLTNPFKQLFKEENKYEFYIFNIMKSAQKIYITARYCNCSNYNYNNPNNLFQNIQDLIKDGAENFQKLAQKIWLKDLQQEVQRQRKNNLQKYIDEQQQLQEIDTRKKKVKVDKENI